jgi:hypothetical protein
MCTFRPLKLCRRVSGELISQNVDEILLPHDSAHPHQCENTVSSHKTEMDFFPTYHTAQILLSQISTSFEPLKMPSVGKSFGSNDEAIKEWL